MLHHRWYLCVFDSSYCFSTGANVFILPLLWYACVFYCSIGVCVWFCSIVGVFGLFLLFHWCLFVLSTPMLVSVLCFSSIGVRLCLFQVAISVYMLLPLHWFLCVVLLCPRCLALCLPLHWCPSVCSVPLSVSVWFLIVLQCLYFCSALLSHPLVSACCSAFPSVSMYSVCSVIGICMFVPLLH